MSIRISTPVVELLKARGLLPEHCREVTLMIPASGAMILTFQVFVATEHLDILAEVFAAQAAATRADDARNRDARLSERP